jgi:hypothetical protein
MPEDEPVNTPNDQPPETTDPKTTAATRAMTSRGAIALERPVRRAGLPPARKPVERRWVGLALLLIECERDRRVLAREVHLQSIVGLLKAPSLLREKSLIAPVRG